MGRNKETSISSEVCGSVGGQTFYRWRGEKLVRMKNSGKRKMTPEQLRQQKVFERLVDLADLFGEAASVGFAKRPLVQDPENAFAAANAGVVTVDDEGTVMVDYPRIACSSGKLKAPKVTVTADEAGVLTFVHEAEKSGHKKYDTDMLYAVLLETELQEVMVEAVNQRKDDEPKVVTLDKGWKKENLHIYVFYRRNQKEGKQASRTVYVEIEE